MVGSHSTQTSHLGPLQCSSCPLLLSLGLLPICRGSALWHRGTLLCVTATLVFLLICWWANSVVGFATVAMGVRGLLQCDIGLFLEDARRGQWI